MTDEYEARALNVPLTAASNMADATNEARWVQMDESTFRVFYEQTSRPLLRYLLGTTRNRDLAEDLLQETYCRFLAAGVPELGEREARSYLFRIATNLMHDRWRRTKEDSLSEKPGEIAAPIPQFERKLELRQAFERMKPRERQLLWLAYVEGSNHDEIADCTGLRAGSVRLLLFRARRRLADLISIGLRRGNPEVSK